MTNPPSPYTNYTVSGVERHPILWDSVFARLQYALFVSRTVLCEDVGPFQSSKTKAALAAFSLFVSGSFKTSAITPAALRYSPQSAAPYTSIRRLRQLHHSHAVWPI